MPVLAVGGAQWMEPMMDAIVMPVAPDLRVEIVANSGLFVTEEAPEAVCRIVQEFLDKAWRRGEACNVMWNIDRIPL